MDNKGFAITGILYGILILFLTLLALIIFNLQGKKVILDKQKKDVFEKVDSKVDINEPELTVEIPTAKTIEYYTGSAQALINAGVTSAGEFQYKIGENSYSTSIPTGTQAGSYTVYYKVVNNGVESNTGSLNITIPQVCEQKCGVASNGSRVCANYTYNSASSPYCNLSSGTNGCTINGNNAGGQICSIMIGGSTMEDGSPIPTSY